MLRLHAELFSNADVYYQSLEKQILDSTCILRTYDSDLCVSSCMLPFKKLTLNVLHWPAELSGSTVVIAIGCNVCMAYFLLTFQELQFML